MIVKKTELYTIELDSDEAVGLGLLLEQETEEGLKSLGLNQKQIHALHTLFKSLPEDKGASA